MYYGAESLFPNIKHPRNHALVGDFHIIGTTQKVFNIGGMGV